MADAPLRVALTGGTGFVGRHVLPKVLERGHRVRVLARDPERLGDMRRRVEVVAGDLSHDAALRELVAGCDAVVHLVGIIMERPERGQTFERVHHEGTLRLLDAARAAGVRRWVHMSALGARPDAVSDYHRTKWLAEEAVRASGLAWAIFRPSIIHGPDGEFMRMVRDFWVKRFPPFVPYFARGMLPRDIFEAKIAVLGMFWPFRRRSRSAAPAYVSRARAGRLQPVWVEDVAHCFADALTNPHAVNETYALGGPDVYTWPQLYLACRPHLRRARPKKIVALPVWYAKMMAGLPGVPFNRDQVIMSQEDSVCEPGKAQHHFGVTFAPFETTFAEYAARLEDNAGKETLAV